MPYFLSKYDPDPLRFYLTATAPETRDTEFSWEDFVERNNNELVATARLSVRRSSRRGLAPKPGATWANVRGYSDPPKRTWVRPRRALGSMLSFAYKRFDGHVPEPGDLDAEDRALLETVEAGFETVGELYNACKFRAAPSALLRTGLGEALALAREANGYLDRKPAVAKQLPS